MQPQKNYIVCSYAEYSHQMYVQYIHVHVQYIRVRICMFYSDQSELGRMRFNLQSPRRRKRLGDEISYSR